jgi:hypothetical protein
MYPGPAEIMCGAKLEPSPRVGDTAERHLLFGLLYSVPVLSTFPNHSYKPAMKQIQRHTRSCLTQPRHRGKKIQVWNTLSLFLRRFAAPPDDCLFSLVSPYPNVYVVFLLRSQGGELGPHLLFTALSFWASRCYHDFREHKPSD